MTSAKKAIALAAGSFARSRPALSPPLLGSPLGRGRRRRPSWPRSHGGPLRAARRGPGALARQAGSEVRGAGAGQKAGEKKRKERAEGQRKNSSRSFRKLSKKSSREARLSASSEGKKSSRRLARASQALELLRRARASPGPLGWRRQRARQRGSPGFSAGCPFFLARWRLRRLSQRRGARARARAPPSEQRRASRQRRLLSALGAGSRGRARGAASSGGGALSQRRPRPGARRGCPPPQRALFLLHRSHLQFFALLASAAQEAGWLLERSQPARQRFSAR